MTSRRLSLPSLKLTRRPAFGKTSVEFLQREVGLTDSTIPEVASKLDPDHCESASTWTVNQDTTKFDLVEPTDHELESRASVAGWKCVRQKMLGIVTEMAAMPLSQVCLHCEALASIRCRQCGTKGFYCQECFLRYHSEVNVFHMAEKWEVSVLYE